ncbi:site-specific recombinase, DNA invertase Pin [Saccharomonospora glauca K62]|uniref:Site-specific recombinase, DNA invertase Pin n=2 Tax=Saccharomonospora glauca TaxID=40990 RepID=I1CWF9_9PSEU|nr:site-specific recombinase, DNA invertase Pin [Saccharomonospora glauca K62]
MKAIAYVRCASPNPDYEDAQKRKCVKYAQEHGLDIMQTYSETGIPRSLSERLLAAVAEHRAEAVIVKDAARLGRNPAEYARLTDAFRAADVKLCLADLNRAPGLGSFEARLLATIAAIEDELLEETGMLEEDACSQDDEQDLTR